MADPEILVTVMGAEDQTHGRGSMASYTTNEKRYLKQQLWPSGPWATWQDLELFGKRNPNRENASTISRVGESWLMTGVVVLDGIRKQAG